MHAVEGCAAALRRRETNRARQGTNHDKNSMHAVHRSRTGVRTRGMSPVVCSLRRLRCSTRLPRVTVATGATRLAFASDWHCGRPPRKRNATRAQRRRRDERPTRRHDDHDHSNITVQREEKQPRQSHNGECTAVRVSESGRSCAVCRWCAIRAARRALELQPTPQPCGPRIGGWPHPPPHGVETEHNRHGTTAPVVRRHTSVLLTHDRLCVTACAVSQALCQCVRSLSLS